MKKAAILATVVLVLAVGVLPAAAITGGEWDEDAHPNVGAMVIVLEGSPDRHLQICSGTLISSQTFLTAGHCTDYLEYLINVEVITLENVYVSFDSDNALYEGLKPIQAIHTHPAYWWGPQSNPYDLGALTLEEPILDSEIPYAVLPEPGLLDQLLEEGRLRQGHERAQFTVVGYGLVLEWPPPEYVEPMGTRYKAESEFLNLRKAWLTMSQNQAPGRDDGGTCSGDSGGPTFWTEKDGSEILVAVTSWGDAPCVATGIAYRVDIESSLEFIESLMD